MVVCAGWVGGGVSGWPAWVGVRRISGFSAKPIQAHRHVWPGAWPRCQGGSVVCRLQARLSPLWASAPHPGAFPTSPVPEALPSCPSLLLQPSGPVSHAAGGPARQGGRAGVWVWGGMGEKARRLSPGPEGVRGYPREEAGSKLPLIPWQLSEGGNVVCHFTATEVQLGPRRVPGNSGSSPWARSSSGFRHTACHLVRENECMRA